MERHALALEMDLLEPASEWVQFEPEDPHGAELRSALAAAVQVTRPASLALGCILLTCRPVCFLGRCSSRSAQGLIYIAEEAAAAQDSAVAARVFDVAAEILSGPEPGEAFIVRMGSSAREEAAFVMLALGGGAGDTHANVVAADEPSNGAFATKSFPSWVSGVSSVRASRWLESCKFVWPNGFAWVDGCLQYTTEALRRLDGRRSQPFCASLCAKAEALAERSEWWAQVAAGPEGGATRLYGFTG